MEELILFLLVVILILLVIIFMKSNNQDYKNTETNIQRINDFLDKTDANISQSTIDISNLKTNMEFVRQFTDKLDRSPNVKGTFGEEIVRSLLQQLPKEYVQYQYKGSDINGGTPDFVLTLPDVVEKLVIDAKFIVPKDNKATMDKIVMKRAEEIQQYITPNVTFDFILMWIPELVYLELQQETHRELRYMNIIATTTGFLRPLIFLIQRFALHLRLNEQASEYTDFRNKTFSIVDLSASYLDTGIKQLENSLVNIKKSKEKINSIKDDEGGNDIIDNS